MTINLVRSVLIRGIFLKSGLIPAVAASLLCAAGSLWLSDGRGVTVAQGSVQGGVGGGGSFVSEKSSQ